MFVRTGPRSHLLPSYVSQGHPITIRLFVQQKRRPHMITIVGKHLVLQHFWHLLHFFATGGAVVARIGLSAKNFIWEKHFFSENNSDFFPNVRVRGAVFGVQKWGGAFLARQKWGGAFLAWQKRGGAKKNPKSNIFVTSQVRCADIPAARQKNHLFERCLNKNGKQITKNDQKDPK